MSFLNIPAELRDLDQWVVWRSVRRGDRPTKLPFNPFNPSAVADTMNPGTWGDFETALRAVQRDPNLGLGFVFTTNDPFIGIDFDAEDKVAPELRDNRAKLVALLMQNPSYSEWSPSGKGHHVICRGTLAGSAHVVRAMQIEVYASGRFFTMTGNVIDDLTTIQDKQADLDAFVAKFPKSDRPAYEEIELLKSEANGRRLGLTDDQVLEIAFNLGGFHARYHAIDLKDWSDEHRRLIGDLDKITGDPEQVQRIVANSPLVKDQPAKNGETRSAKSERLFATLLSEVRQVYATTESSYRSNPSFIAHGRQIALAVLETNERRRQLEAQRAAEVMEALRKQEEEGGISKDSSGLLLQFSQFIGTENLVLTRPPGFTGEFVEANERGSYHPFTKYAIPSTLAVLSGILGRRYKVDKTGLNLNFLLAAESGTGKTDHGKAWETFLAQANERLRASRMLPFPKRMLKGSAASVQGIGDKLQLSPSVAWFVDEAYQMVRNMTDEKSPTGTQLRNSFNEMYDSSSFDSIFELPASRKTTEHAPKGIPNLNVSTYWTMTPEEFDNFTGSVSNGFMSRMLVIRETATYGSRQKHPVLEIPYHLQQRLDQMLSQATLFDEAYEESKDVAFLRSQLIPVVMDEAADALYEQIADLIDETKRRALRGEISKDYMMVNRIPVNAKKIAGLLAVVDSPYNPVIGVTHLKWAVGYLVQNIVQFLSDVDRGELGSGASDEVKAVVRMFKTLLKKHKGSQGIPKKELHEYIKQRKPFKTNERGSPSIMATNTIEHMLKEDILIAIEGEAKGPGRRPTLLAPGEHPAWEG